MKELEEKIGRLETIRKGLVTKRENLEMSHKMKTEFDKKALLIKKQ